jgi:hypothetical protein
MVEHGGGHQRVLRLAAAHQRGALGQRVVDQRVAALHLLMSTTEHSTTRA